MVDWAIDDFKEVDATIIDFFFPEGLATKVEEAWTGENAIKSTGLVEEIWMSFLGWFLFSLGRRRWGVLLRL